jgi:hypothetical protein
MTADHTFGPGDIVRIIFVSEARHTLAHHLYRYAVVKEMDLAEQHRMIRDYGCVKYLLVRIDGAGFDVLIEPEWLQKIDMNTVTRKQRSLTQALQAVFDRIVDHLAAEDVQNPYLRLTKKIREAALNRDAIVGS